jgi:hypothetical protein
LARVVSPALDALRLAAIACLILPLLFGAPAQANMTAHGGPVMVNQVKTYLIYWTPSGVVLDSSVGEFPDSEPAVLRRRLRLGLYEHRDAISRHVQRITLRLVKRCRRGEEHQCLGR